MLIDFYVAQYGYPVVVITMVAVGVFGAIPSSKLLYVSSGYLASIDLINFPIVVIAGSVGHSIGNFIQYQFGRWKGEHIFLRYLRLSPERINRFRLVFLKRPVFWLFFGKLVDPIKWVVCFIAGTTKMAKAYFFPVVFITSIMWASAFCSMGFFFGKSVESYGWIGLVGYMIGLCLLFLFARHLTNKVLDQQLNVDIFSAEKKDSGKNING